MTHFQGLPKRRSEQKESVNGLTPFSFGRS
jgi:hypothetical protein